MEPTTLILPFAEFDAFWLGAAHDCNLVIIIDGDLGVVFITSLAA